MINVTIRTFRTPRLGHCIGQNTLNHSRYLVDKADKTDLRVGGVQNGHLRQMGGKRISKIE